MRYLLLLFISVQTMAQPIVLTMKNVSIGVDVAGGARIVSLKVEDREILGTAAIHPRFYGSSLWLSPEGKWKGMGGLDAAPYVKAGDGVLKLRSAPDTVRGFQFTKEIRLRPEDTAILIHYTITNTAAQSQEVAPWEVTRVPTGGLAFFPSGDWPALAKSDLTIRDSLGYTWYPYDTSSKVRQKLFRHGARGWTAYVRDGILFVKRYPIIAVTQAAPGEENVEVYANPEKTYIELENQGAYQSLASGASLTYDVVWYARRMPLGMTAAVGNKALIAYVRNLLKQ